MTVSTTHISNDFTGDGSTVMFNFTFQVMSAGDLKVTVDGTEQVGYTVALNTDQEQTPGGWVTLLDAPEDEAAGKIERVTALTQDIGFTLESKIDTNKLEGALDRLVMMLQESAARTQGPQGIQGPQGPIGPGGDMTGPGGPVTAESLVVFDGTSGTLVRNGPPPFDGAILKGLGGYWIADTQVADIPSGMIALWDTNLAAIPTGWEPMDGRTVTINGVSKVTPDTRGKYLLCAAQADTGSSGFTGSNVRSGTVGGTKVHTHVNGGFVTVNPSTPTGVAISGSQPYIPGEGAATGNYAPAGSYPLDGLGHSHSASIVGNTGQNSEAMRPIHISLICVVKVDI